MLYITCFDAVTYLNKPLKIWDAKLYFTKYLGCIFDFKGEKYNAL